MKIAWATDIHLSHASKASTMFAKISVYTRFVEDLANSGADAIFITGDIAEATSVWGHLGHLDHKLKVPIYFVLGNHDYYGGSIKSVRAMARKKSRAAKNKLYWMPEAGVVKLTDDVAVVGVDGWGDARYGNVYTSTVGLNDWLYIKELSQGLSQTTLWSPQFHIEQRIPLLQKLGDIEAAMLQAPLIEALESFSKVFVLTHVPPWDTATWHDHSHSHPDWQPWFSCKAVGEVIEKCAKVHRGKKITVLCGHCFDLDTELLTPKGWRFRSDLSVGADVMTWNRHTRTLEYNKISEVWDHKSSDLITIRTKSIDLRVTPGHGLISVSREGNSPEFFLAIDTPAKSERTFMVAGKAHNKGIDLTNDEIRLAVWIAADGNLARPGVRFHFKKQRKVEALTKLLTKMGARFTSHVQSSGSVKINLWMGDSMSELFNSVKHLPLSFREANESQAKVLADTYAETDGCLVSSNRLQIATSKKSEADLLQAIFVTNGRRCLLLDRKENGYILTVATNTTSTLARVVSDRAFDREEVSPESVWCVTVPNGSLLVRRNGRVCITQNTHGKGRTQISNDIKVLTGGATYGAPEIAQVFEI